MGALCLACANRKSADARSPSEEVLEVLVAVSTMIVQHCAHSNVT